MRGRALVLVATLALVGCNLRQRVAGGGVALAVTGLYMTYSNEARAEEEVGTQEKVGIAFVLTGLVTLFVAAALDESATKDKPTEIKVAQREPDALADDEQRAALTSQQKRDQAWALTKQAQDAARVDDCAKVAELSAQVGAIDAEFYADVFMKDVAVQRCFVPAEKPAEPAPEPAPVPAPIPPTPPTP
jgi:hypothetical protein